ncbi:MAG: spondin domain-containing protein [Pseudomonadota bacterium]
MAIFSTYNSTRPAVVLLSHHGERLSAVRGHALGRRLQLEQVRLRCADFRILWPQHLSTGLATLAEGGNTSVLGGELDASPGTNRHQTFGGMLAPATVSAVYTFETDDYPYLSMAAMLLPTNDGFVGLDSWVIPTTPGTYTINLNAYDAGSEANDEIINGGGALGMPGIPVDPGGNNGTGATGVTATEANTTVHIHRGNIGDDNPTGGVSDANNTVHRWLNPVARLIVTIN